MTKQIGAHAFSYVCVIQPETDNAGRVVPYAPQALFTKRSDLPLHAWGTGPFCRFRIPAHLRHKGVYAITAADELRYIGECQDLASRYNAGYGNISPRNCYTGGQSTNCRLNNLIYQAVSQNSRIDLWFLQTDAYKTVEAELIAAIQPSWNRKGRD